MNSPAKNPTTLKTDIVIFGGGIAGLWILNHLIERGYNVILVEANQLGSGQSIASQGIIHGGLKYALDGAIGGATNAISEMPDYWRRCLDGKGGVDLTDCAVLSQHYFMWSDGGVRSRLKTFLGSKALRGKIEVVSPSEVPMFLTENNSTGTLYQLSDFVIDTGSLLSVLAAKHHDRIIQADPSSVEFGFDEETQAYDVQLTGSDCKIVIQPQRILFTAGEGNQQLMQKAGISSPQMQVRPLQMVMVRSSSLPSAFLHCIGDSFSLTPKLTLTSHQCDNGEVAWYLGGELAESGVDRTKDDQILTAKGLLSGLFPQLDFSGARWNSLLINRAEGFAQGQHRPDSAFVQNEFNIMVAWPTKFTLSPALADMVSQELENQSINPLNSQISAELSGQFKFPGFARPPWETHFD